MAIISASIEANGWVLAITHDAGLGSFSSYVLDPDGAARCTVTSSHPGYAPSGGQAVAVTAARTLVGTKPLRKPVQATPAGVRAAKAVDEVDLGGGRTTVRIALSQFVYATDTGVTLTVLAGWRSGQPPASGIAVTNNSTLAASQPIVRWSDTPYLRQSGPFDLEVVAYSQHPNGVAPVAGVKFTVTDGTTVKTYWATALSSSAKYRDGLRCYRATVDAAAATALTGGLLRCDYEVYPWIGAPRVSDTAGTRSMTGLGTAAFSANAQSPFAVFWDPLGNMLGAGVYYVYIDTAGSNTATAVTVSTDPAAAAAGTPAANWSTARQAIKNKNRTIPAANGQPSITQATDGCVIRKRAGAHTAGGAGVAVGVQTLSTWEIVEGDPADPDPRSNVVLIGFGGGSSRLTRVLFRNITIENPGAGTMFTTQYAAFDNVEYRAAAGFETSGLGPTTFTGTSANYYTNMRSWNNGQGLDYSVNAQPMLARNCEVERAIGALVVLNCKRLPTAKPGTYGVGASGTPSAAALEIVGATQDRIVAGNDLRYIKGQRAWGLAITPNASAGATALGTTYKVASRQVFANNVVRHYQPKTAICL